MAKKKSVKDNDDFDEATDDLEQNSFDEYEEIEFRKTLHKHSSNARRRHEQLKEDRALARLLSSDFDYFDDYNANDFNNSDNDYGDYSASYE